MNIHFVIIFYRHTKFINHLTLSSILKLFGDKQKLIYIISIEVTIK